MGQAQVHTQVQSVQQAQLFCEVCGGDNSADMCGATQNPYILWETQVEAQETKFQEQLQPEEEPLKFLMGWTPKPKPIQATGPKLTVSAESG